MQCTPARNPNSCITLLVYLTHCQVKIWWIGLNMSRTHNISYYLEDLRQMLWLMESPTASQDTVGLQDFTP